MQVKYDWTPPLCPVYNVFGHCKEACPTCVSDQDNKVVEKNVMRDENNGKTDEGDDFTEMINKR